MAIELYCVRCKKPREVKILDHLENGSYSQPCECGSFEVATRHKEK